MVTMVSRFRSALKTVVTTHYKYRTVPVVRVQYEIAKSVEMAIFTSRYVTKQLLIYEKKNFIVLLYYHSLTRTVQYSVSLQTVKNQKYWNISFNIED